MKLLFILAVLTALVMLWVWIIRPMIRDEPWAQGFFAWIEPIELHLWRKSETILFARFKMIVGLLLTVATQAGDIDITPLMPIVPDSWEPTVRVLWNLMPLTITALGFIDEQLRKDTTKPLEIVALPEVKPPAVALAEAKVEAAVAEAKATVAEAKAEGVV